MSLAMPAIIGASQQKRSGRPFIIKVKHTAGFTFTLPLVSGAYNYNFIVDYGDGTVVSVVSYSDANKTHTYATGDNGGLPWVITVAGTMEAWSVNNASTSAPYIVEVTQWGRTGFKYLTNGFYGCTKLTSCYGSLTTISLTSLSGLFMGCTSLTTVECGNWNVTPILSFQNMWNGCTAITNIDCGSWVFNSTSNVSMYSFCNGCTNITSLNTTNWNTTKITNWENAFRGMTKLSSIDTSTWVTANATSMGAMFYNDTALTSLDVSGWNVSKVVGNNYYTGFQDYTNGYGTFQGCSNLVELDCTNWRFSTTSNVYIRGLFRDCVKLESVGDTTDWNMTKIIALENIFYNCQKLESLEVGSWDISNCTLLNGAFYNCKVLSNIDVSNWNVTKVTNLGTTFVGCISFTSMDCGSWVLNTTSAVSFKNTWTGCTGITTIGDISGWTTQKVSSFEMTWAGCSLLNTLDVSNFNTSGCASMGGMFYGTTSLTTIDVSGFDVSKVVGNNGYTGFQDYSLSRGMFQNSGVTSLDLSSWSFSTTSNLSLKNFCNGCSSLTTVGDTSGWTTTKITSWESAFCGTKLSSINSSGWNMANVTSTASMFYNCTSLTSITLPDSLTLISNYSFYGCTVLVTINIGTGVTSIATGAFNLGGTAGRSITYNFYRSTAPTISGTPFANFNTANNVALHIPAASSSYTTAPWTTDAIFDQPIIKDL